VFFAKKIFKVSYCYQAFAYLDKIYFIISMLCVCDMNLKVHVPLEKNDYCDSTREKSTHLAATHRFLQLTFLFRVEYRSVNN